MATESGTLANDAAAAVITLAQQAGSHAFAIYAVLLLASMGAAGLAVRLAGNRTASHGDASTGPGAGEPKREPNLVWMLFGFAAGFGLVLVAAWAFAEIAEQLGPGRTMALADQALTDAVRTHTPAAAVSVFTWLTHLGDPEVLAGLALIVAVTLWRLRRRILMIGWLLALGGIGILNPALKQVFARVRPVHDAALAGGYSFPSGHSAGAMVAYGMLAYLALRTLPRRWHSWTAMLCVALVVTIAMSRIFIGVHFASDVAAGLLEGFCWLGVCVASIETAWRWRARHADGNSG